MNQQTTRQQNHLCVPESAQSCCHHQQSMSQLSDTISTHLSVSLSLPRAHCKAIHQALPVPLLSARSVISKVFTYHGPRDVNSQAEVRVLICLKGT